MNSKTNRRWMKTALESAAKSDVQMPWARGTRREEMLARRDAAESRPAVYRPRALAAH